MALALFNLTVATSAQAATIQYDNRATFEAAAGVIQTVTFDDVQAEVFLGGAGYDAGAFTLSAFPGTTVSADGSGFTTVNGTPHVSTHGSTGSTVAFTFDNPIKAFGLDMARMNNFQERMVAAINGTTYHLPITESNIFSFFGLISDTSFSTVTFTVVPGTAVDAGLDNISFASAPAAVPEPTSIALVASGLAGVLVRRRRRTV